MSRKYKFKDQQQAYFVSFAVVHWIDLFTRSEYCDLLIESLRYCLKEKGLVIYAWCIMPSHVQLIIGTNKEPMQNILRDFKSYTSRHLRMQITFNPKKSRKKWLLSIMEHTGNENSHNKDWQLWQQDNHPIELSTNQIVDQKLQYLHYNPVVAGFVESPDHWRYSSATDYYGGKGMRSSQSLLRKPHERDTESSSALAARASWGMNFELGSRQLKRFLTDVC